MLFFALRPRSGSESAHTGSPLPRPSPTASASASFCFKCVTVARLRPLGWRSPLSMCPSPHKPGGSSQPATAPTVNNPRPDLRAHRRRIRLCIDRFRAARGGRDCSSKPPNLRAFARFSACGPPEGQALLGPALGIWGGGSRRRPRSKSGGGGGLWARGRLPAFPACEPVNRRGGGAGTSAQTPPHGTVHILAARPPHTVGPEPASGAESRPLVPECRPCSPPEAEAEGSNLRAYLARPR